MFWPDLSREDQLAMLDVGSRRRFRRGERLFVEGDHSTHVVVVLDGRVKVARSSVNGGEALIEIRGPGSLLGEMGVIEDVPRSATMTALTPVDALIVGAQAFRTLQDERTELAAAVVRVFSHRLRQSTQRQLESSVGDASARLCGRLVELAADGTRRSDGTIDIELGLTQQELGEWIGVTREAVVNVLRHLRDLGWIETGRMRIRILDLESLRAAAVS